MFADAYSYHTDWDSNVGVFRAYSPEWDISATASTADAATTALKSMITKSISERMSCGSPLPTPQGYGTEYLQLGLQTVK